MKKRILVAALGLIVLVGALSAVKAKQIGTMIEHGKKMVPPPDTVTAAVVAAESWETVLSSVGSLTAVQGVTVAAELPGKVAVIAFEPGAAVKSGQLLVRQDTAAEEARLPGALAEAELARTVLARGAEMLKRQIISQADYDTAAADVARTAAAANNLRAVIAKKSIRAPFAGRVGIRQVNLGQMLREGDPIVTLQSLDPIHVDFSVPQQQIASLGAGLPVRVTCDALPGVAIDGRITAVNPLVDAETRNIRLQATIANREERLRPGMFVNVAIRLPQRQDVLTIPATAVLYAPYGDSVFVVEEAKGGAGPRTLRQQFVRIGERRGDFVAVAEGLRKGEGVVSTGVFKLRNGQAVVIDNTLAPPFRRDPAPPNS